MSLPENAPEIFAHAARHDCRGLLGKAAPYLVGTPLDEVIPQLPGHLVVPWVCSTPILLPSPIFSYFNYQIKYHTAWELQLREARSYPCKTRMDLFDYDARTIIGYMDKLEDVKALKNLTGVFGEIDNDGGEISNFLRTWRTWVESNLATMGSLDIYMA